MHAKRRVLGYRPGESRPRSANGSAHSNFRKGGRPLKTEVEAPGYKGRGRRTVGGACAVVVKVSAGMVCLLGRERPIVELFIADEL